MRTFEVVISVHGMPALELIGPDKPHQWLRRSVVVNHMDSPFYKEKQGASPFLQGQDKDWTLVEFWGRDYERYVDFLNNEFEKERKDA
jgi:hypothetical protein